ncbi:DUF5071 domain-containing protein [Hymenobacter sp. B81]|uniref:DUF5071 domain-containing protein n=1 Tax=Hymenobacter sp. B81 TaxID=3344878 RepID=UPI0037DD8040
MTTEPRDPQRIVPVDKYDDLAVENLRRADKAAVLAQAGPLLHWLQDGNWPVAMELSVILNDYTNDLVPELLDILRGTDGDWKYWCVIWLIRFTTAPRLAPELLIELRRIADLSSRGEQELEPIEEAQEVWEEWMAKEPN